MVEPLFLDASLSTARNVNNCKIIRNKKVVPKSFSSIMFNSSEYEVISDVIPQQFQVIVNIIEAREISWSNTNSHNSYVIVALGKKKHKTAIKKKMVDPYYREIFIFEIHSNMADVQRSSIWLAVMEPRFYSPPKLLGETTIDLGYIWSLPNHQMLRKWAQLSAGGFLKVDVTILRKGEAQMDYKPSCTPSLLSHSRLGREDYILPISEQQQANYVITIYNAFGLPGAQNGNKDKKSTKPPNTFVRLTFCGIMAKTAIQYRNNNPSYNERISITEMFPNLNDTIRFEICSVEGCFNRILCTTQIKLGEVSHGGDNGFLPTFGPSLIHMYNSTSSSTHAVGDDGPNYRGALLVSLKTEVPYFLQELRTTSIEPVPPLNQEQIWTWGDFIVNSAVLEVSMLDPRIFGNSCGIAVTIGDVACFDPHSNGPKPEGDFISILEEQRSRKLHYTGSLDVNQSQEFGFVPMDMFPVLQIATPLPDYRYRVYRNNMIRGMIAHLEETINQVEQLLRYCEYPSLQVLVDKIKKAIDETAVEIVKLSDIIQYCGGSSEEVKLRYSTDLDHKQTALTQDELGKVYENIITKQNTQSYESRKKVKLYLADLKTLTERLKGLVFQVSEGLPDIVVWLLSNGSRVAYCKLPASDVLYSGIQEQCGRYCGKIKTLYMRPLRCLKHMNALPSTCNCLAGKVEFIMWMGLYRQISSFQGYLPKGYKLKNKDHSLWLKASAVMIECRVFVYRAKLNDVKDRDENLKTFFRVNILNSVRETESKPKTSMIIWNEMLKFSRVAHISTQRLEMCPPKAMCEVYDVDDSNTVTTLVGRFEVEPVVDNRTDYNHSPRLQAYDIMNGRDVTGRINLSIQILEAQERHLKTTTYSTGEVCVGTAESHFISDIREPLPVTLLPQFVSYKIDINFWGLRDVVGTKRPCVYLELDELVIQSDVMTENKSCCNFTNPRTTRLLEVPTSEQYFPAITLKLLDSCTFGRTLFVGMNIIKNPKKFFIEWYPKCERDSLLNSSSILSFPFQVPSARNSTEDEMEVQGNSSILKYSKESKWKGLFSKKEFDEERISLLPVFDRRETKRNRSRNKNNMDWWLRYYMSLNDMYRSAGDMCEEDFSYKFKLTVYNSELELQPDFSKFKDWCATLKLYNRKKTGIPEKDELLQCGFLKAGIAIYKWPPPEKTVAVSSRGADLSNGYFSDYPSNEPKKFLVRAYIVRGINLAQEFDGKSNPYIVIRCGQKEFGDRSNFVPMASNPIFGRVYEFRCTLPTDYLLTISLYDYNISPPDELIGSTTIDLEDRIYTRHRAMVGLPTDYNPNRWRDCIKPTAIFEELCTSNHMPLTMTDYSSYHLSEGNQDTQDRKSFMSLQDNKESICLSLLNRWHTLPICGYRLVPEHVETRSLYNPEKPGEEQGKIQMWIDIFPLDTEIHIPSPVDITPRRLGEYELRVVVWEVRNIKLKQNKRQPEVMVKTWLGIPENYQHTDVQQLSIDKCSSFNWRMIFDLQYHHAERKILIEDKGPFTEVVDHATPNLVMQLMEYDPNGPGEVIGSFTLNLNAMSRGVEDPGECTLEIANKTVSYLNIFTAKGIRAWWPLTKTDPNTCETFQIGIINMEVSILPKEKAILSPVGYGRNAPCPLPRPKSSKASFQTFFFSSEDREEISRQCFRPSKVFILAAIFLFLCIIGLSYRIITAKKPKHSFSDEVPDINVSPPFIYQGYGETNKWEINETTTIPFEWQMQVK